MGERYWKAELADIIDRHNDRHAVREKIIAYATRQARRQGLFRIFVLLRQLGYRVRPRNLATHHVDALMAYWLALAEPAGGNPSGCVIARSDTPYSAAYIQQQMSFLRVYADWIGKPGLVRSTAYHARQSPCAARTCCATSDRSWEGNGVDAAAVVARVAAIDRHVGVQLRLMMAFGLRRKEAVMFCPEAAEVPAYALPESVEMSGRYVSFLRVIRGTKGGRLRYTAVRTPEQVQALEAARALVRRKHGHIGRPGLSLKQSLDLFSNVVRLVGLTKKALGVTPHGLRHQFAGDLYFDIAQLKAPVQGGEVDADPRALKEAYRQVAEQLGHHRPQISNAYLGSPRKAPRAGAAEWMPEAP